MAIIRATSANDNIGLGSDATFLGGGGDDVYVFDPNLFPADATIEISDSEGVNTLRLPDGVAIAGSTLATLSDGGVAMQLTLSNGTTVFVDRADEFRIEAGGDTGGNGATVYDLAGFAQAVLGVSVPAPGGLTTGGAATIGAAASGEDAAGIGAPPAADGPGADAFDFVATAPAETGDAAPEDLTDTGGTPDDGGADPDGPSPDPFTEDGLSEDGLGPLDLG